MDVDGLLASATTPGTWVPMTRAAPTVAPAAEGREAVVERRGMDEVFVAEREMSMYEKVLVPGEHESRDARELPEQRVTDDLVPDRVPRGGPPRRQRAMRFFDRQGRPISRAVWESLSERGTYTYVAYDTVRSGQRVFTVLTYWLGLPVRPTNGGRPAIFHTVIDGSMPLKEMWSWSSVDAALRGHRAVSRWLQGLGAYPAEHDLEDAGP